MESANKPPPPASQLNPHEAVMLIDALIMDHVSLSVCKQLGNEEIQRKVLENMEVVKRQLTDYFLAADGRKGIYVKGPND